MNKKDGYSEELLKLIFFHILKLPLSELLTNLTKIKVGKSPTAASKIQLQDSHSKVIKIVKCII